MRRTRVIYALLLLAALLLPPRYQAQAHEAVVRAVLFYSPTCGHCHIVMTEVLPPLQEEYGDHLQILEIDVTEESGRQLYQSALAAFQVPDDRLGVPTLIFGEVVLVGSREIPEQLPGLIASAAEAGGNRWPAIPGLEALVDLEESSAGEEPGLLARMQAKFAQDRLANSIAVLVLAGLVLSLAGSVVAMFRTGTPVPSGWLDRAVMVLSLAGLGVAAYLSVIELTKSQAICGPVGNCNAVQSSSYAYLFGVLPVGVLGAIGYLTILGLLLVRQVGPPAWRNPAGLAIWGAALVGTLFSAYLTFLEPFVIGASCAWCLTSAVIMGVILALTTPLARAALALVPEDELEPVA